MEALLETLKQQSPEIPDMHRTVLPQRLESSHKSQTGKHNDGSGVYYVSLPSSPSPCRITTDDVVSVHFVLQTARDTREVHQLVSLNPLSHD